MENQRPSKRLRLTTADPWARIENAIAEDGLSQLNAFETGLKSLQAEVAEREEVTCSKESIPESRVDENVSPEELVAASIHSKGEGGSTVTFPNSTFTLCLAFPPGLTACYRSALRAKGALVVSVNDITGPVSFHVTSRSCQGDSDSKSQCAACRQGCSETLLTAGELESSLKKESRAIPPCPSTS